MALPRDGTHHAAPSGAPEPADGYRILAFCDYFSPGVGGGAERVAYEVYSRLAAEGARITVLTTATHDTTPWPDLHPNVQVITVPTIDLRKRTGLQLSLTRGATAMARAVAEELRPHLLHANSLEFQTSIAAARLARSSGTPAVLTAHIGGFAALPAPWRAAGAVHERTVGRYLLASSRRVVAVSDAVAAHLRRWTGDRIRVVPNGVDHKAFHPEERRSARSHVELLFVGRLIQNKGPRLLLDAFRTLRRQGLPVRLRYLGDGPMRAELERTVRGDDALRGSVELAGFTDDVAGAMRGADVLVRPSLTEGMPLGVLEAMASGVCVVASDVPGNRGLIRTGETGLLFRTGDTASLTEALRRAVLDRGERERMASEAHRSSLRYSWDRCARETFGVFQEVAPRATLEAAR